MWRATVIERIREGLVVVSIPALFRGDPVGPMQSAVDAQVGDAVVVADLVPDAKIRDWWVIGYESQVGRWGNPYPHEHPMGQVIGLVDALAGKANVGSGGGQDLSGYATKQELTGYATTTALTNGLAAKADTSALSGYATVSSLSGYATTTALSNGLSAKADTSALSGYATTTALSTGLGTKVNTTTYNSAMSGKANVPTPWVTVPLDSRLVADSRSASVPHSDVVFAIRRTPLGLQIRGMYNISVVIPAWTLLGTIPEATGLRPPLVMRTLAPAVIGGVGETAQLSIDRDGTIRNRDQLGTGWVTFDWLAPDYYA